MSLDWEEAFEGPLSEFVPDRGTDHVRIPWPAIERTDRDLAEMVLNGEGGHKAAEEALRRTASQYTPIRIYDIPERKTYRVGKYGSSELGSLIAVRGRVISVDSVTPFAKKAAFECIRCGTLTRVPQSGGDLIKPAECQACESDGKQTRLNIKQSDVVDLQRIHLKRAQSSMDDPPVEMVQLWEGLCETLSKDDVVTIVGIYDVLPAQDEPELETYLDAVSINKSEQPATVDEVADWKVKKWAFDSVDRLSSQGSDYDTTTRAVVEAVSNEYGVAEGEIQAALSDLEALSYVSKHQNGRVHITTSSTPTFEPAE